MRNESSASETTPLRRPESESPDNVAQNHRQLTDPVVNNNHSNSNKNKSDYGDSVTVRLQDSEDNNKQQQQSEATNMDTNKRILCRVGLDVLILLCGK